ncbi:MAG TPA: serine hydrolase [Ktedonobacteraceae bacterium]|nr:serine hydrolase [Ktedonobacteraceae bacterium]
MQERQETGHPAKVKKRSSFSFFVYTIGLLLVVIGGALFLNSSSPIPGRPVASPGILATPATVATNGADLWIDDATTTAPDFDFSPSNSATEGIRVSPLFEGYYTSHHGAVNLGAPVTVAFPTNWGWLQFFESDALLLPEVQPGHAFHEVDPLQALMTSGVQDSVTGITRLPLLQALLTSGSQLSPGNGVSSLTYADLRKATNPDRMLPAPVTRVSAALSTTSEGQGVFIEGGSRAGKAVGHQIPQQFWSYINQADIAPDGWETDFGPPLTEALVFSSAEPDGIHHMLVQLFWRDAVVLDENALDASGQPRISRLKTSVAYLRTLDPPPVALQPQQGVWTQGDTSLLDVPETGQAVAHVGLHFPLTLPGDVAWNAGMLWYHVQWSVPHDVGAGWVEASSLSFDSPGNVPGWASFDVLSPALARYLVNLGDNVDAVVYDVTRQHYYTYNTSAQFITGSSMKVPIMLTFLDMTEREGREPDTDEMSLLTTMIENSNNDSASALYYGEIGGAVGVASYLQRIGITGLNPDPDAWGYSLITPLAMVNLLTLLYNGQILTANDRTLAFSLMEQIESDQQVGVGDTAPAGSVAAMKDGWLPGPDGLWAMNSSGIVTLGKETYIISVYTQEQNSLMDGQTIAQHVCGAVASLLT